MYLAYQLVIILKINEKTIYLKLIDFTKIFDLLIPYSSIMETWYNNYISNSLFTPQTIDSSSSLLDKNIILHKQI